MAFIVGRQSAFVFVVSRVKTPAAPEQCYITSKHFVFAVVRLVPVCVHLVTEYNIVIETQIRCYFAHHLCLRMLAINRRIHHANCDPFDSRIESEKE